MNIETLASISSINLETVVGGAAAKPTATTKPAAPSPTAPTAPNIGGIFGDAFKGCLSGAGGGITGGAHGAAIGCAVGAGGALLKDLGSQFGLNLGTASK